MMPEKLAASPAIKDAVIEGFKIMRTVFHILLASLTMLSMLKPSFGDGLQVAKCLRSDDLEWWENSYIQLKSGADDYKAEAFLEYQAKFKNDRAVPTKRCSRIIWLKEKVCKTEWKLKGKNLSRCLKSADFKKEATENYEYYFGG